MFSPHAFPGVQPGPQYDDNANNDLIVMVQIESRQGVENVEKIAAVPGLDGLLIGTCLDIIRDSLSFETLREQTC